MPANHISAKDMCTQYIKSSTAELSQKWGKNLDYLPKKKYCGQ